MLQRIFGIIVGFNHNDLIYRVRDLMLENIQICLGVSLPLYLNCYLGLILGYFIFSAYSE